MTAEQPTQAEQQAEATAARLLALYALYEAGRISLPDFTAQGSQIVYAGKVAASRLADVLVSMLAQRPALGIRPGSQHLDRLSEALTTITDPVPAEGLTAPEIDAQEAVEGIPAQLERLAISEALESRQRTTAAALRGQGYPRYREVVAEDACEVCEPFRDQIHDSATAWRPHHPRCRCELEPDGEPDTKTPETKREEPSLVRLSREVVVR